MTPLGLSTGAGRQSEDDDELEVLAAALDFEESEDVDFEESDDDPLALDVVAGVADDEAARLSVR